MLEQTKVLEFWGKQERHDIALWYNQLPNDNKWDNTFQSVVDHFVSRSYNMALEKYWCQYVDGQPYETADDMREFLKIHRGLYISHDYNTSDGDFLRPSINLMFRFAHDIDHCKTENCNFAFRGEICAASKFMARTLEIAPIWSDVIRQWLFTEIIGQAAFRGEFGYFGEQKFALAPMAWVKTVCDNYGI